MNNKTLNELSNEGFAYAIIKIDETEHWHELFAKAAGKIYGVYLVELNKPTHCCSLSVSYPSENIKNFIPNPPEYLPEDTLFEYEYNSDYLRQDCLYLDGNSVFEIAKLYNEQDGDLEQILEYESGNPSVC